MLFFIFSPNPPVSRLPSLSIFIYIYICIYVFALGTAAVCSGFLPLKPAQGINLDDVFSGVFFSPEGDLLDIPSDEDEEGANLNLTLSSATISDGARHPQFAQFAVYGSGPSRESVTDLEQFMTPLFKPEDEQTQQEGLGSMADAPSSTTPTPALQQMAAGMPGPGSSAEGSLAGGLAPGIAVGGNTDAPRLQQAEGETVVPTGETTGAAAAVSAAAAEARVAQETASSKAAEAVKAAAAHAQVFVCLSCLSVCRPLVDLRVWRVNSSVPVAFPCCSCRWLRWRSCGCFCWLRAFCAPNTSTLQKRTVTTRKACCLRSDAILHG